MTNEKEWLIKLMRLGFVANGVVYITIGLLAMQAAIGVGGQTSGSQGALSTIATQPFGQLLLIVICVGLIGMAIWYFIRGAYDPDNEGSDAQGVIKRIGLGIAGLGYGILAYSAFRILSTAQSGGGDKVADWTAVVMQQRFGIWLVGLAGVAIIGVGVYQLYKAYQIKFRRKLQVGQMSQTETEWGIRAGRIGIAARAIIFGIIGLFLVQAAMQANPQQAGGVGKALETLASQSYGSLLLGTVSLGLIAYGLYSAMVLARYRRFSLQ